MSETKDARDKSDVTGAKRWIYAAAPGYDGSGFVVRESGFVVREETPNTAFDEWPLVAKIQSEADARAVCVGHDVALACARHVNVIGLKEKTLTFPPGVRGAQPNDGSEDGGAPV
jgi:hypothetical protein